MATILAAATAITYIAVLLTGLTVFFPSQGLAATVTVDGITYELSGEPGTYSNGNVPFESQPWWGDPALAFSIAGTYVSSDTADMFADFGPGVIFFAVSSSLTTVGVVAMGEGLITDDIDISDSSPGYFVFATSVLRLT